MKKVDSIRIGSIAIVFALYSILNSSCKKDINPSSNKCNSVICENGGVCDTGSGRIFCDCPTGYYGDSCQIGSAKIMFIDDCAIYGSRSTTGNSIGMSVYVNSMTNDPLTKLSYEGNSGTFKGYSGYQNIAATSNVFYFSEDVGGGWPAFDTVIETLSVDSNYSGFVGGTLQEPIFIFTSDDLSAPSLGYAKVRFINLDIDAPYINCSIGSTLVVSSLAYESCSMFFEVPETGPGVYVAMSFIGTNATSGQQLSAGKIYTFMLAKNYAYSYPPNFLSVINNN